MSSPTRIVTSAELRDQVICELQRACALLTRATVLVVQEDERGANRDLALAARLILDNARSVTLLEMIGPDV